MSSAGNSHRQLNMASSPQPVWPWMQRSACQSPVDFTQPFYTQDGPLYDRWRRLSQTTYPSEPNLRAVNWKPVDYPFPIPPSDPTYWMLNGEWGANTLWRRPFYQTPSGACVMGSHCIDGTSPLACNNFENDAAHAFYSGKTCRELKKILGPNYVQPAKPTGTSCRAQPQGCLDWN